MGFMKENVGNSDMRIDPPDIVLPPLPSADPEVAVDPRFDLGVVSKAYRVSAHEELARLHTAGASGTAVVAFYTRQIDRLIIYLFHAATQLYARRHPLLQQRCAVFAVGGYGRGELNPYSDVDLLFLYPTKITPYAETVWETIYYSLINANFVVSQMVGNVKECVRLANQELTSKSSLLDHRYLCGDEKLAGELSAALEREITARNPKRFFEEKTEESRKRHQEKGGSIYMLEPDIKDGPGGLRDLHTVRWLAKVKYKIGDLRELITNGVLSARMLVKIEEARDFLWRIRNGLHLLERKEEDRLSFERQEELAPALGFADVTEFMRCYYGHATAVYAFSQMMIERCLEARRFYNFLGRARSRKIREGVHIVDGTLEVTKAEILTSEPLNLVTVFHDAQRHQVRLADATQQLIRDTLPHVPATLAATPALHDAFFAILNWKERIAPTLYEMHALCVLEWLLPEFAHLRWRTQRDLYHVYTVDEHTLHGVSELERLRHGDYKTELPLLTQVMREIDKVAILFLSMLYHDVGKGYGQEHSARGAQKVQAAATRWRLTPDDTHEWRTLVQHHLLMSHIAQHRDLGDDTVIADFARTVGTPALLKKLYLLTFADMKAVNPKVWNAWKGELLNELYLRTLERFETGEAVEEGRDARLQRRKEQLRHTLSQVPAQEDVATFLGSMPETYFLSTPEEAMPGHFQLLSRFRQREDSTSEPYRATLVHFPEREFSELTLVTNDRPGLFAVVAGVLTVNGLNIADARITTSRDGIALDVFRLSHMDRKDLVMDADTWTRAYARLGAALRGDRTMADLLRAASPPAYLHKRHVRMPTEVTVDNAESPRYTVIDIVAPDRMGLLFTVTYALFQLGAVIHLAKITTNVDQVLDVFYVTDSSGAKVADPDGLAGALRSQLVALGGNS